MNKIIWTCWFQGRSQAPYLVEQCLRSWETANPTWELRCLDAYSVGLYAPLGQYFDLSRQAITAASLSDIVRILLLREFGGVWVDATLFCQQPLDAWLPEAMEEGFFAFSAPAPDRILSSWFLAAQSGHPLLTAWHAKMIAYWTDRTASDDYFWLHHLFGEMCSSQSSLAHAWSKAPRKSADGPHSLQHNGLMHRPAGEVLEQVDWNIPVFKLSWRMPPEGGTSDSLLHHLLGRVSGGSAARPLDEHAAKRPPPARFGSLKVSTENLGDHIQIICGKSLLSRIGVTPELYLDRDNQISSAPGITPDAGLTGILLNGWFKTNRAEWPPNPALAPVFCGFHIRLFQCPELLSAAALAYYRANGPIGCRDAYTLDLLQMRGIEAFLSHCLSLTLPNRPENGAGLQEVFVVSRDRRILNYIPASLGPVTFISHYSGTGDFSENMAAAQTLLDVYRTRARLIITTLLHCALPALAMGIPVVTFYPINNEAGQASDRERFSSLETLMDVHHLDNAGTVDWDPKPVDVSAAKLQALAGFYKLAKRWNLPPPAAAGPIAPASILPLC